MGEKLGKFQEQLITIMGHCQREGANNVFTLHQRGQKRSIARATTFACREKRAERREPWRRYYWRSCVFAVSYAFLTESTCAEGNGTTKIERREKWYVKIRSAVNVVAG